MNITPIELLDLNAKDLKKRYRAEAGEASIHPIDVIQAISARDQAEQTPIMRRLTVVITVCTIVVTVATILQLAIAFGTIGK